MKRLAKKLMFLLPALTLMLFMPLASSQAQTQGDAQVLISYVIDVSASMKNHGFNEVLEAVISDITYLKEGDIAYIIPFAENEREIMRVEYEDTKEAKIKAVELFIRNLSANGQFTNLDEGIDAALVKLMDELAKGTRTIILISDCASDPDPYHATIKLDNLSGRIPRGLRLYLIDLSNSDRRYPGFLSMRIGAFSGFTKPGTDMTIFPLKDAVNLKELLSELRKQAELHKPSKQSPVKSREEPSSEWDYSIFLPYAIPLIFLILLAIAILLLLKRRAIKLRPLLFEGAEIDTEEEKETESENSKKINMFYVRVGDVEKRFGPPVMLTVGGSRRDDFVVRGARRRELSLLISEDKQYFWQRKGLMRREKGSIFSSRSFLLMNGTPVSVNLESDEKPLHRYLKQRGGA